MLLLDPEKPAECAPDVFARVWRTTLDQPGFAVLRLSHSVGSHELRRIMFALFEAFPVRFVPERLGRFDQQVSSKFHRDGAPPESFLLLGYEASPVRSRIFIADSSRAAIEAEVPLPAFVARYNPMFPVGEAVYHPFVTELELPHGEPYIVAINNSLLPFAPSAANPLGVLHKAIIDEPDPTNHRVINSVGFMPAGYPSPKSAAEVERFLTRTDLD
ncbi:MAG: hypothetical protein C0467_01440 [Planctomycetaceae bacterium]|nr:hypothetical protein [Planctomycetaceae bacterium]